MAKEKTSRVVAKARKEGQPRRIKSGGSGTPKGRRFRSLGAASAAAGT